MKRICFAIIGCLLAGPSALAGSDAEWSNLDGEHRLGGRKMAAGYLRGKVVLVARWRTDDAESKGMLRRMEQLWENFKTKPFVLLGAHETEAAGRDAVVTFVKDCNVSFPVYEDVGLKADAPKLKGLPAFYLLDASGKVRYAGRKEHVATERLVMFITDLEAPKNRKDWERYLDYDVRMLPGRALLRLEEYNRQYPEAAKKYAEQYARLKADADVQKLSKLVTFAKRIKDSDASAVFDRAAIEKVVADNADLKGSKDPLVVQEAKNALADLAWALAAIGKQS